MDAPAMLFPVSRFKTAWNVGKRLRQLLPRRECTDAHIATRGGLVQCGDYLRTPPGGKADDVPPELLIEFMLNPRHILMLYANTPLDALKAHTGGEIKEEHSVAICKSHRQRPGEIAVDDPLVLLEDHLQTYVEFLTRDGRAVWLMPQHVQIVQRQSGRIAQPARERAFACTGGIR